MRDGLACVKPVRYGSRMEQTADPFGTYDVPPAERPTSVIASRVRALRKRHGWTADQLAERMTAVGIPWTRIVVTKLETGRRPSVSVDEWLALALVLGVAPVHLLVPTSGDEADEYAVTPRNTVVVWEAREWIRGRMPLQELGQDARVYFSEVPADEFRVDQASADDMVAQFRGADGER